jgi:uncharacterized metal-binding protein YceD (DUF177 family)
MAKSLTTAVSLARLAAGAQVFEIEENITGFPRLYEALHRGLSVIDAAQRPAKWEQALVTGQICFDVAGAQSTTPVADVTASVKVPQVCQRCLDAFSEPLAVATKLIFVRDDEAPEQDGYENWELDEDRVRPLEVVDELLVMALPFAALHDDANCHRTAAVSDAVAEEALRPFADLRAQMEAASKPAKPEEK